jgi:hypothetical protein
MFITLLIQRVVLVLRHEHMNRSVVVVAAAVEAVLGVPPPPELEGFLA